MAAISPDVVPVGQPPAGDVAVPEKKPPFERQPQKLSEKPGKLLSQLRIIASDPARQVEQRARDLEARGEATGVEAVEQAKAEFAGLREDLAEKTRLNSAVREAFKAGLKPGLTAEQVRQAREGYRRAARERREYEREVLPELLISYRDTFRNAVQLEPDQIPLSGSEKVRLGIHEFRQGVANVNTKAEEGIAAGTHAVSEAAKAGVHATTEGAKAAGGAIKGVVEAKISGAKVGVHTAIESTRAGAQAIAEKAKAGGEAAVRTAKAVGQKSVELEKGAIEAGLELGRKRAQGLVEAGVVYLKTARAGGEAAWKGVVDSVGKLSASVQSTGEKTKSGLGRFFGGLKIGGGKAVETVSAPVGKSYEAVAAWTAQVNKTIEQKVSGAVASAGELLAKARADAGQRLDQFKASMASAGESAKGRLDTVSKSVIGFASEQAKRVASVEQKVQARLTGEIKEAIEKGKTALAPAWESIQKDRQTIRENTSILSGKLGILMDMASDAAHPVIDRILDEGRDVRDAAIGLGKREIQAVQNFGRAIAHLAREKAEPAWEFLTERWEDLRLRANSSRDRLNTFLNGALNGTGARFQRLAESASAVTEKTKFVLSGVVIEGGRVLHNGVGASQDVIEWFAHQSSAAREFMESGRERVAQGMEMVRRYWEVYAVGKWHEMGISSSGVKNRLKLMRGIGAASLAGAAKRVEEVTARTSENAKKVGKGAITAAERAGSLGAAAAVELANRPGGSVALGAAAVAFVLATNPELISYVGGSLQNAIEQLRQGGVQLPDLSNLNFGIQFPSMPDSVGSGNIGGAAVPTAETIPVNAGVDLGTNVGTPTIDVIPATGEVDLGQPAVVDQSNLSAPAPAPSVETATQPAVSTGQELNTFVDDTSAQATAAPVTGVETGANVVPPPPGVTAEVLSQINPGQPIAEQLRELMPNVSEAQRLDILVKIFQSYADNFEETARAIVNGIGTDSLGRAYTSAEITSAREQLKTIAELGKDPSVLYTMGVQEALEKIAKAVHWWHP